MKNLNKIIVIVISVVALALTTVHAQNVVTLQHGNSPSFFTSVDAAIAAAVDGDFIYIPGGVWAVNENITKAVNLVGAGALPDSTNATGITVLNAPNPCYNTEINISGDASGGSCTGIYFGSTYVRLNGNCAINGNAVMANYLFSRCRFAT